MAEMTAASDIAISPPGERALVALPGALALDRASPVPLYHQLVTAIGRLVSDGTLRHGDQLPGERDLAEMAAVSRMTARQALGELDRSGIVTVRQGVGTFVAAPKLVYDAIRLQGFTEMAEQSGQVASTSVVDREIGAGTPPETAALGLGDGVAVLRLTRVRSLGGVPIVLETSTLAEGRFGDLIGEDLSQSLYRLLELRHGVRPTEAEETIEARPAGEAEARLLGIAPGAPTLVLSGTARDGDGPIEWFQSVYPGERVKLSVRSQRQAASVDAGGQTVSMVLA